jgi:hypothetical protein
MSLTWIDHGLHPLRRLHPHANPFQSISEQDWQARHLPPDMHDHLGYHIGCHRRLPKLCWTGGVSFLPGLYRSRILPRMLVLPQRMVYKKGIRSENGGALFWKFDLGGLWWADYCGNHE